jgi:hypothetical protein
MSFGAVEATTALAASSLNAEPKQRGCSERREDCGDGSDLQWEQLLCAARYTANALDTSFPAAVITAIGSGDVVGLSVACRAMGRLSWQCTSNGSNYDFALVGTSLQAPDTRFGAAAR